MFDVNKLFFPLKLDEFVSGYFEKKHLILKRNNAEFYNELISISDIDEVLFSKKLNAPSFRLVDSKTETFPDIATYCKKETNVIDPVKFIKGYAEGHTLAMAGFQDSHFNMRNFCYELENVFGHPSQTNLYLTPKESKGFAPHGDSHDVIVLQISGKKHWKIYENSIKLADKNLAFDPKGFDAGVVIDEFILEAVDLLYIPRGLTHDAYTSDDHSLHITTGILGYTWSQYLIESILTLTRENPEFREFLPLGVLNERNPNGYIDKTIELTRLLGAELKNSKGLDRFIVQRKSQQDSCATNQLHQIMNLEELSLDSRVMKRKNIYPKIDNNESMVKVTFGDTYLEFPIFCHSILNKLINLKENSKIRDLTGEKLDDNGTLVLVKKLIKEGLVINVDY